ncbi:hypothetical protein GCM10027612_31360 [Microbispora bryophytorum subsp. camponoti]
MVVRVVLAPGVHRAAVGAYEDGIVVIVVQHLHPRCVAQQLDPVGMLFYLL